MILSLYVSTPSTYARIAGGIWCLLSGGPSSMRCARSWSASSAAVAIWTSSHPRGVLETAARMAVESPLSSSSDCGAMDMPARSDDEILGLLRGQSTVGAVTSSWSGIFAGFVAPVGWQEGGPWRTGNAASSPSDS